MISGRKLSRDEISEIWTIDRSEVIDAIYYLDNGALRLRPEHCDLQGWPPGEAEKYSPILEACYDQGGWLISHTYRGQGRGQRLFDLARVEATQRGANSLYVSATPSENTIDFYLRLGCKVIAEPDRELFELEPEDIHLECALG